MMNILSYAARFLQLKKIQTDEALKNGITAVLDKGGGNPHNHVLFTMRAMDESGFRPGAEKATRRTPLHRYGTALFRTWIIVSLILNF